MRTLILLTGLFVCAQTALSQTSYTWNGAVSSAWNTAANWSPAGVPGSADNATIVAGGNTCLLAADVSLNNLILNGGNLNLGGFTLVTTGPVASFISGTVQNGTLSVSAALSTSFGSGSVNMNCIVNVVSAAVTIRNSSFQNITNITKTGASNDGSAGNNVFNGVTSFSNTGTGYLMLGNGNPDHFNNAVSFNNTGSGNLYVAYNSANNVFAGITAFNNAPSGNAGIYVAPYSAGTMFNDDVLVSSTSGLGVLFCSGNATATATLSAGSTISLGPAGFSAGSLLLRQFTQLGSTAISLTATGSAALYLGPSSSFGGAVSVTAPDIWAQGATYNAPAAFTKTGGSSNHNNQYRNIFNATCTINQQSNSGYFMLGYNSNDLFNDDIIVSSAGSGAINLGWSSGTGTPTLAAGKTILVGAPGFSAGALNLNAFTQLGNAPVSLNFSGSNSSLSFARGSVIGGDLSVVSPDVFFSGASFNGMVTCTKTGAGNDAGSGNNIFQGLVQMNNAGSGYMIFGNGAADTWNDQASFSSTGSSFIGLAWNSAGNLFDGDITVSSTGASTGIQFCQNGSATAMLSAGKTVSIGAGGFSSGSLLLRRFTQAGSAALNLLLTGTSTLVQVGPASAIGGPFTASSPRILMNGAVYTSAVVLTKTGATGEWSTGGNTFNSTVTVNQAGGGFFGFANGAPDVYNGDLYANNNSTDRIIFGNTPTGNQFNGNIILTQTGASVGIAFGWSSNSSETLAAGKTISIGAAGYSVGYLQIGRFTQLGNAPVDLLLTGTSSLTFGPSSALGGDLRSSSGSLYFNGCVFSGTVDAIKTGTTGDNSSGNNIFQGTTTISNAGSGNLLFGNGNADQFLGDAHFNNTGSGNLYVAYNSANNVFGGVTVFHNAPAGNTGIFVSPYSAGTVFSGDLVLSSTNGQGIQFCGGNSTATATLSAGKTISIAPAGFSAGTLLLRQFTQVGATAQQMLLTGTANLTYGPSSSFGGDILSSSPTLFLNGAVFAGTTDITKTGTTGDYSAGGNVFNGNSSISNSGSSFLLLGNSSPDTWNSDVVFTNSGSERLLPCWATAGNQFNGDITVNTSGTAAGIQFCGGNAAATATLAVGKTIRAGATGLTAGYLILKQFTQLGNTPISLSLSSTAKYLQFGPGSSFGGDLTSSSPGLFFNGATFNGQVNCAKTGSTNDQSQGNNIFNGQSTFTDNGTGYLMMTTVTPDVYNGNTVFVQTGSGPVYPNYNGNSSYAANLTVSSAAVMSFGANTGTATFSGSGAQTINVVAGTPVPVFTRLVIANSGSGVTLGNTAVNVSKNLLLNTGLLHTSTAYMLTMLNGSTTAAGTALSTSYVDGPMRYQKSAAGATTLNFPIGSGADCRPVSLTVNHSSGNLYTYQAQVFNASASALGYLLPVTVDAVSTVHYYTIGRVNAASVSQPSLELSGNQTIQLFFGANDVVRNGGTLTIVKNTYSNLTKWIDIGGTGGPVFTGDPNLSGSITSTSLPTAFNSFSTFALGDALGGGNVLPVRLLYFKAKPNNDQVDLSWATATESRNAFFTIERSRDAEHFEVAGQVDSRAPGGNSETALDYASSDINPYSGLSYYRLKQTDLDGHSTYSNTVPVNFDKHPVVSVYPNPSSGSLTISGLGADEHRIRVSWFDLSGRNLLQETASVENGIARLSPAFANGIYVLRLVSSDGTITVRNIIISR